MNNKKEGIDVYMLTIYKNLYLKLFCDMIA